MCDDLISCDGKRRFQTFDRAEMAAKRQPRSHEGDRFKPYHCKHCDGFHVGTTMKQRKPSIGIATHEEWEELSFIESSNKNRTS